jgi:Heterokaryon incompatibility protein (HET)
MAKEYEYKPLEEPDSIRLIDLQPSSDPTSAIWCSLVHITLSSEELRDVFSHYTTLSYVWGCPDKVETIWIDDALLKITANLFLALRDLRHEKNSFLLWADGICINQKDNAERGVQVQLMGNIYQGATNTIIYLGPADLESDECRYLKGARHCQTTSSPQLLFSVLNKEWFTRVWILQELVFSKNPWVQCGTARARWTSLCRDFRSMDRSIKMLDNFQEKRYELVSGMYHRWQNFQSHTEYGAGTGLPSRMGGRLPMLELVISRRGLGVSDPRKPPFICPIHQASSFISREGKTCSRLSPDSFSCKETRS